MLHHNYITRKKRNSCAEGRGGPGLKTGVAASKNTQNADTKEQEEKMKPRKGPSMAYATTKDS